MSHQSSNRMFWFRGSAMAVSGRIESPLSENIDVQAACVLPPTGGFAATSVDGFRHKNIVRFERATSTVSGRRVESDGKTTGETLTTVAIEGLNILDVVTADRVVARLTSLHAKGGDEDASQPEIFPFGSHFENLRIGGVPIECEPYPDLIRRGRQMELLERCASGADPCFIKANGEPEDAMSKARRFDSDRARLAPLFDLGKGKHEASAPEGSALSGKHGILIPGFGVAYFGEYLITRASRRLIMMRIELGCPIAGSLVCGYVDTNGHWDP